MRPVVEGDRGPAVEDIQRRLLSLGFEVGPTGVDGVFLGATLSAVRSFQRDRGLIENGSVDSDTWAALVDATFTLGDRLLYLRVPYFHGRDVSNLQTILNSLGFTCGDLDGIYGTYTERAVRDFQKNVGQPADGIVGMETVRAVMNLRHIWEGKESRSPSSRKVEAARAAAVLAKADVCVCWLDEAGRLLAERVENLAKASLPDSALHARPREGAAARTILSVGALTDARIEPGVPVVVADTHDPEGTAARVMLALASVHDGSEVFVDLRGLDLSEESQAQAIAVGVLDGICAALA